MDHVVPRAQGGTTRWDNIVVACIPCNSKKADRTPAQAKMPLAHKPIFPVQMPGQVDPELAWVDGMPESWRDFLTSVSYWYESLART